MEARGFMLSALAGLYSVGTDVFVSIVSRLPQVPKQKQEL